MFSAEDVNKLQKLSESLDKAEHIDIRVSKVGFLWYTQNMKCGSSSATGFLFPVSFPVLFPVSFPVLFLVSFPVLFPVSFPVFPV